MLVCHCHWISPSCVHLCAFPCSCLRKRKGPSAYCNPIIWLIEPARHGCSDNIILCLVVLLAVYVTKLFGRLQVCVGGHLNVCCVCFPFKNWIWNNVRFYLSHMYLRTDEELKCALIELYTLYMYAHSSTLDADHKYRSLCILVSYIIGNLDKTA